MHQTETSIHPVYGHGEKGNHTILIQVPHYYLPGLNTYLLSNISNSHEAVQHYSAPDRFNLPLPYVSFSEIDLKINAVMDFVKLKVRWKHDHKRFLKQCREIISLKTLHDLKDRLSKDNMYMTIPFSLTRLTSNMMENPDQYFDSEYNWYFKNTIDKFHMNGKWYLACARGTNLDILDIISISNNSCGTILTRKDTFFKDTIYDLKFHSNELLIRQKTKLFVFCNNFDSELLLNNYSIYDNCDIPLADADITANHFCTADVKHFVKLWKDGNCIQNKYLDVIYDQTDSFLHLSYFQNQTDLLAIINRHKLHLIDSRIDISKPCVVYDPNNFIEQCEELTALKHSSLNNHSFYVTSNHAVLTLDDRMGFMHKSFHMLSTPPSLITTHCYENNLEPNELLLLGNQSGENLISLTYTSSEDNFLLCQTMPSLIPKPFDSLHNVRFQGNCLNPMLLDRFDRCLIGTVAYGENFEDLRLFSVNSAGDVFVQKLNNNTPIDVADFNKTVTITSQKVPKLNYSKLCDMSKLWKVEPPCMPEKNVKRNSIWSFSKEKMVSYVDHLAPIILSPWDIDDLSEWEDEDVDEDVDTLNDDFGSNYVNKINYWFNKNNSLLESSKPSKQISNNPSINLPSQDTAKTLTSESSENSSSGYTVNVLSEDD